MRERYLNRLPLLVSLCTVGLVLSLGACRRAPSSSNGVATPGDRISQELATEPTALEASERQMDTTVWAKEMLAQACGRTFEDSWDALNAATNKLALAASFPFESLVLGRWNSAQTLPHGIELRVSSGPRSELSPNQWRQFVEELQRTGWQLAQTEFRHNRFDTDEAGQPRQSQFFCSAHLTNSLRPERAIVVGDLIVDWAAKKPREEQVGVGRIDASGLTIKTRQGEPAFRPILSEEITSPQKAHFIDPLIVYDLDGDGLSEIILASRNVIYRRHANGGYASEPLSRSSPGVVMTAVIAAFTGDGTADLLCAKPEGLFLFQGSPQGTFDVPGRLVWSANQRLRDATVLTCGDIDHDGDLDVFIGQYKVPTLGQVLRPDYYDANDGHPSYLLLNGGQGDFTDATAAAGLGRKRWRRTYSASFADLNSDGHLDLVVVSDFAGLDLYRNDGQGHFTDVTREWVAEAHAFGMAHALADFNADGRLDLLMIGMPSPTVDRLEHSGLWRPDATEDHTMRSRMSYGNRLYLARPGGGLVQTSLNETIARSGWSWGCSAFDFDNDGQQDVYIANGLQSKQSVRDYEGEFWLHDMYVPESVDPVAATAYFLAKFDRTRGSGWSYGGYEKNRLYLNREGESFLEVGHLMGVALEQDCRNVVSDDLDGDGRLDLVLTTLEVWPEAKQTLRVFLNGLKDGGNWIGFRFREQGGGDSPVGVRVTLMSDSYSAVRELVTGDSHRSQHANTVHFGLGKADRVDRVLIRWPDGQVVTLREPALNRYHLIVRPDAGPGGLRQREP